MYSGKTVGVIIAAAGSGTRMEQAAGLPKQFMLIDGGSVCAECICG